MSLCILSVLSLYFFTIFLQIVSSSKASFWPVFKNGASASDLISGNKVCAETIALRVSYTSSSLSSKFLSLLKIVWVASFTILLPSFDWSILGWQLRVRPSCLKFSLTEISVSQCLRIPSGRRAGLNPFFCLVERDFLTTRFYRRLRERPPIFVYILIKFIFNLKWEKLINQVLSKFLPKRCLRFNIILLSLIDPFHKALKFQITSLRDPLKIRTQACNMEVSPTSWELKITLIVATAISRWTRSQSSFMKRLPMPTLKSFMGNVLPLWALPNKKW